jgi:hypothetical protein
MCNVIIETSDLGYRHNNPVEFNRAESRLIVYEVIKAGTPVSSDSCITAVLNVKQMDLPLSGLNE